jgi:glycosyltransferase involved in cell wall biosynthesis
MATETNKKTKVLIIVTQSDWGGAQRYVFDLASNLPNNLFDVHVAAGQSADGSATLFERLAEANIPATHLRHLIRPINFFFDLLAIRQIYQLCKTLKPDVVHLNSAKVGIVGSIGARLAKTKKIVYTVHGFAFHENLPVWKKILYRLAEKLTANLKDAIICLSNAEKKSAISSVGFAAKKIMVIPNGINADSLNFLEKDTARRQLGISTDGFIVGTIANFYPAKALPDLIAAFAIVHKHSPTSRLVIIGDGIERAAIEKSITATNLNESVLLLGKKLNAAQYLKAFDIYVNSSTKEGFPFSIIEAMLAGLPIAATAVGAIPEIVQSGSDGIVVTPRQPALLAEAVIKLTSNQSNAHQMGNRAQQKALQNFSLRSAIKNVIHIYQA